MDYIQAPCVAPFPPNIQNAFRTAPALLDFIRSTVKGNWGADPSNIYLVAHSLGNLASLEGLRIASALYPQEGPLLKHMISVEAAVWEETFWPVEEVSYLTNYYTIDELKRGSWAFWFNQDENPVSSAAVRIINSYSPGDNALRFMKIGDWSDYLGIGIEGNRVDRAFARGDQPNYRVPVPDGFLVGDPMNRPDLSLEIPALIDGNVMMVYPTFRDITDPLGTVKNPLPANENQPFPTTISILAAGELGWSEDGHSDFLTNALFETWKWYERLMREDLVSSTGNEARESIIPRGTE